MRHPVATAVQIERAIKAAQRAGLPIERVEVDGSKIVVISYSQVETSRVSSLDKWLEKRRGREESQSRSQKAG